MIHHNLIDEQIVKLNREYLRLHQEKEDLFWATKMGLTKDYQAFNEAEARLQAFRQDVHRLRHCREMLASEAIEPRQAETLRGWVHFYEANVIENPEAQRLADKLVTMESDLAKARGEMNLGYVDPATGAWQKAGSVELMLKVGAADSEALREACYQGLESIEEYAITHGFLEIVKERNRLARLLGYEDYYDYKVNTTEGFGKAQLFGWLDDLEERTRGALQRYLAEVKAEKGEGALKPWNFRYATQGDAVKDLDPYLGFGDALSRWGRSFAALGISYEQAVLQLDLVARPGKYENGFCHAPVVPFEDAEGRVRAAVNFTSLAVPGQVGSGARAAKTLFHEGGHAAHFANILMGAPCFSQEFAPTSIAFAETQSMFLDSLLEDADWLARYARDAAGKSIPWEVIEKATRLGQPAKALFARSLMIVCYAEKALYEMPDEALTPANVRRAFVEIERRLYGLDRCPRPTLAVPHLLAGESSCIYHGYVLAQAGVAQTRWYFLDLYGHLTDNPAIGPRLKNVYWRPGNARRFVDFIEQLTGKPFAMDALVEDASLSADEAVAAQKKKIERLAEAPPFTGKVELDCSLRMVHGDRLIASTEDMDFAAVAKRYEEWLKTVNA